MKEIGLTELPVPLSYIRKSIRKEIRKMLEMLEIPNYHQGYKRFGGREDESL